MSGERSDGRGAIVGSLESLAALTTARVGLGRTGASMPLSEVLRFGLAHAQARDAVHEPFRADDVAGRLAALGLETIQVESAARTRGDYLRRPDLGRSLSAESRARLPPRPADVAVVVGDGLSAAAVHRHAAPFMAALLPLLQAQGRTLAPAVVASQARVALGDGIGAALGARLVVMLVGERPGLSAPDSLGAYVTHEPRPGIADSERNCVSNIRPDGLPPAEAAYKVAWLVGEALRRGLTGVALKDESGPALTPPASHA